MCLVELKEYSQRYFRAFIVDDIRRKSQHLISLVLIDYDDTVNVIPKAIRKMPACLMFPVQSIMCRISGDLLFKLLANELKNISSKRFCSKSLRSR